MGTKARPHLMTNLDIALFEFVYYWACMAGLQTRSASVCVAVMLHATNMCLALWKLNAHAYFCAQAATVQTIRPTHHVHLSD